MKYLILVCITISLLLPNYGSSCSMYKLTKNGKTIVGNNEDWTSPNGQFWFETGTTNTYGVMYMGFLDNFAQGAISEAGLIFDGFWEPYLEVKNLDGKLEIPIGDALQKVMQTMDAVEDVQAYLETINLSVLDNGQLVFVDKSGKYLIVEGDEMIIGNENEKTFSNFYYSQIESIDEVEIDYFQKGQNFINTTETRNTFEYCTKAMDKFSQTRIAPTQYTTIYDLSSLKIRIHLFHDYSNFIELDLKKELQKGNHRTMIAELFPPESTGFIHFKKYNNPDHPTLLIEELLGDQEISEQDFLDSDFDNIINGLGFEWLDNIKNTEGAIKVFKYGLELMPNHSGLYNNLGTAYFENSEWDNAIINYAKSLTLNPKNKKAIEKLWEINQLLEGQSK